MHGINLEANHIINIYQKQQIPPIEKGNLYLSGVYCLNAQLFKKLNINCVLSIINKQNYANFKIKEKVREADIKHHKWIDLLDLQDLSIYPYLEETHTYIRSMLENNNVLVHCRMGMSRSASLVIAFLMKQYKMDFHKARIFTKNKRKIIKPNEKFEQELLKFQQYLKEQGQNQNIK